MGWGRVQERGPGTCRELQASSRRNPGPAQGRTQARQACWGAENSAGKKTGTEHRSDGRRGTKEDTGVVAWRAAVPHLGLIRLHALAWQQLPPQPALHDLLQGRGNACTAVRMCSTVLSYSTGVVHAAAGAAPESWRPCLAAGASVPDTTHLQTERAGVHVDVGVAPGLLQAAGDMQGVGLMWVGSSEHRLLRRRRQPPCPAASGPG